MSSQTVTAKGQITLKRDLLKHLGVIPGERISFDMMPSGEIRMRAAKPTGTLESFFGILVGKTKKVVTINEMNEAAAAGWTGAKSEADR
jgi:bifunctional DNA-binding transcriptional regulator/antitoxin component of YhaV-PrlF toxin-antitoxin module